MTIRLDRRSLMAAVLLGGALPAHPAPAECVVPAKAGGGFEATCKLVRDLLVEERPIGITYMPGGIGAVAYAATAQQRSDRGGTAIAFSSGSLLNLAQGKFGRYTETDVRWLAVVAADHGVLAVRTGAPFRTLADLLAAVRSRPRSITFGAGGTLGSQDWFKAALVCRAAGASHRSMRFVAFEGGGDALQAIQGGHIDVFTGDAAEIHHFQSLGGSLRVLAVFAPERLSGALAAAPTAREQGLDLVWQTSRGLYLGPRVDEEAFQGWSAALRRALGRPEYGRRVAAQGLSAFHLMGAELDAYIRASMARYRELVRDFQMPVR